MGNLGPSGSKIRSDFTLEDEFCEDWTKWALDYEIEKTADSLVISVLETSQEEVAENIRLENIAELLVNEVFAGILTNVADDASEGCVDFILKHDDSEHADDEVEDKAEVIVAQVLDGLLNTVAERVNLVDQIEASAIPDIELKSIDSVNSESHANGTNAMKLRDVQLIFSNESLEGNSEQPTPKYSANSLPLLPDTSGELK